VGRMPFRKRVDHPVTDLDRPGGNSAQNAVSGWVQWRSGSLRKPSSRMAAFLLESGDTRLVCEPVYFDTATILRHLTG
jgi:hypothetical protein